MRKTRPRVEGVGSRLLEALRRAGFNQKVLSEKLGVTEAAVSRWVGENNEPPLAVLIEICRLTGTSADEILGLKSVKPTKRRVDVSRLSRRREKLQKELAALGDDIERLK